MINVDDLVAKLGPKEFKFGPLSIGDMIALAGIAFSCGILWVMVNRNSGDIAEIRGTDNTLTSRVSAVELTVSNNYVKRDEYRQDTQRIMDALYRIEAEVKNKQDKRGAE